MRQFYKLFYLRNNHRLERIYLDTTCGLYYKHVTIVIYDRNDIGLYYKPRDDHN